MYSSGEDSEYSDIEDVEDCKMVLVVRNDLKMGKGKVKVNILSSKYAIRFPFQY